MKPPERAVEAGAKEAFWQDDLGGHIRGRWTWDTIPEYGRENYRQMIRAAFSAAHKAGTIRYVNPNDLTRAIGAIVLTAKTLPKPPREETLIPLARGVLTALDALPPGEESSDIPGLLPTEEEG